MSALLTQLLGNKHGVCRMATGHLPRPSPRPTPAFADWGPAAQHPAPAERRPRLARGAPSTFIGRRTTPPILSRVAASRLGSAWTGAGFTVPSQTTSMQTGPPALTSGCGWPGPSVLRPDQPRLMRAHTCGCTATRPQRVPPAMGLQPPAHHHPPDPRKGHVTRPWTRPGHSECTRASVFVIG